MANYLEEYKEHLTNEKNLSRLDVFNLLKSAPSEIRHALLNTGYITSGNVTKEAVIAIKCAHCLGKVTTSDYKPETLKRVLGGHQFYAKKGTPWAGLARQFLLETPSDSAKAEKIATAFVKNWDPASSDGEFFV